MARTGYIEWCNANEQRNYPLTDEASRTDEHGRVLPNDILADVGLIVPPAYGTVFCTSVRVTPALYSVAFGSITGGLLAGTFLRADCAPYTAVALTPLVDDVNGWVVFGNHRVVRPEHYVFNAPAQSQLAVRAVRKIERLPVRRFLKLGGNVEEYVEGLARLVGGAGLTVRKEGTDTIVLSLDPEQASRYLSPCVRGLNGQDCPFPIIRYFEGVPANEYGEITLRFVPHDWEEA